MERTFNLVLHFLRAEISLTWEQLMFKLSNLGRSSTTSSRLVLLNSVLETFKIWRFRSLDNATTTQNLLLSMKVELETLRSLKFCKLHSPRQLIKSVTVALVNPMASSSRILCPFKVLNPFKDSFEASLSLTCFSLVVSVLNTVSIKSSSFLSSQSFISNCSDSSVWKNICCLNLSLASPLTPDLSIQQILSMLLQIKHKLASYKREYETNWSFQIKTIK